MELLVLGHLTHGAGGDLWVNVVGAMGKGGFTFNSGLPTVDNFNIYMANITSYTLRQRLDRFKSI